jgi:hypothetical protein
VPIIDLADETFVVAPPSELAVRFAEPARGSGWWPDVSLSLTRDRGAKGLQWAATGALVGSAEVWLEPFADGTIVHLYLRCDPAGAAPAPVGARRAAAERARRTVAWKAWVHALKDELEAGRPAGAPRAVSDEG